MTVYRKGLFFRILFLSLLLFCLAGVASAEEKVLTFSWHANAGDLNPHLYSPNQMYAQAMVYEPLVRYGDGGTVEPCLAESWEISPDGKTYTFFLRKNVLFSDGTPWDAEAAKKNIDTVLANGKRHSWLDMVNQIESAEAAESHVLKVHLKNPYYPLLQELALIRPMRFLAPSAFPESGNTAEGMKKAVGTGPWVLTETKKGEYDLFVRNEHYWGPRPFFDKILVKVLPDPDSRVVALETGELDLIFGGGSQISLETFRRLEAQKRFGTGVSGPTMGTLALAINSGKEPTNDLRVRQALQHVADKATLTKVIFLDVHRQADTLFSPSMPYCDIPLTPYAHDPARAEALLDEAGWKKTEGKPYRTKDGVELALEFCFVGNNALEKAIGEIFQAELRKVGVKVTLLGEEPDSFYKRQKDGEFHLIVNETWGAPYEPHSMVSSMRTPSHADYQAQSGLPMKAELDAKITRVLVSTDETERRELYREILTTLHEQAVYLPLTYMTLVTVYRNDLKGVAFTPMDNVIPFEKMSR